jgi:hypothetical protein
MDTIEKLVGRVRKTQHGFADINRSRGTLPGRAGGAVSLVTSNDKVSHATAIPESCDAPILL